MYKMKIFNQSKLYLLLFLALGPGAVFAVDLDARVDWTQKVDLRIPVNGIITKVNIETGLLVKKNDLLISLDTRVFKANVAQQQAEVVLRKSNYDEAKRELDRMQQLYDRTMLSEHELQLAKNNLTAASSAWIKAKSAYTRAKVELEHSQLRAPFNAIILKKNAEVGQAIVIGEGQSSLLSLAASDKRIARATVSIDQANLYKIGNQVNVITASKTIPGKVIAINLIPTNSKQVEVVAEFAISETTIMPGTNVKLNVP